MDLIILAGGMTLLLALVYVLFSGQSGSKETQRRLEELRLRHASGDGVKMANQLKKAIAAQASRPSGIAGSSSRLEALSLRLSRTGKGWTLKQYLYATGGLVLAFTLLFYLRTGAFFLSLAVGVVLGAGIPHFVVGRFVKQRLNAFTARFPDAIELLVRGLRSGLPVSETLNVVASELPGPVGAEFRSVVERIKIGRTMEDALQATADRLGTPEFQFFVITLAIQRETGGNLAETLSNLADVLRKRAQMKLKIRALSSESKASAYIVGALPFAVFIMIWWINPEYVGGFFVDERLMVTGLGGLVWMSIGAFIMAKMVSFEV
jgi:tight adherence protein B